ncbi:MAG: helix-turn-helix transcriptional regulator [Nitrospiria bacterium]
MDTSYDKLIRDRLDPGVLIFNEKQEIIFADQFAVDFIWSGKFGKGPEGQGRALPSYLVEFYKDIREMSRNFAPNSCIDGVCLKRIVRQGNGHYWIRGYIVSDPAVSPSASFLVLIEPSGIRSSVNTKERCGSFKFTRKQLQVTLLLARGMKNKEIAHRMKIKETTVKQHIRRIMEKLNTKSRVGIVSKIYSCSDEEIIFNFEQGGNIL